MKSGESSIPPGPRRHQVRVGPLPAWLDANRLLGVPLSLQPTPRGELEALGELTTRDAADLAARLRGLALGGRALGMVFEPALPRAAVRAARTEDARRRRRTTPGFMQTDVRADQEGRYSLTPEALAVDMARRARGKCVLDATCGVGGNAIAFARAGCRVIAVDTHAGRIEMARHNALRYGVLDRIDFHVGDALQAIERFDADLLMVDPPWGLEWNRGGLGVRDIPLLAEVLPRSERFEQVWLKLPPAFDVRELPGFTPRAMFGEADGDRRRVKFLWLTRETRDQARPAR